MADVKFNINEYVWAKLNEKGREILFRYLETIPAQYRRSAVPEVDDDGYSKFQMWRFMVIFSPYLNYSDDPPFDSTVKFDRKDLTD